MDTTHESFGQRLKRLRKERGLTQIQLAKLAKVSQASISDIERGRNEGSESIVELALALGVPAEYLLYGKIEISLPSADKKIKTFAEKLAGSREIPANEVLFDDEGLYASIPRSNLRLSAGVAGYAIDPLPDEDMAPIFFRLDWLQRHKYKPQALIAVKIRGESMLPGLSAGDTVVIDTEQTIPRDGQVFAVNYEGELVIKRMSRDAGAWWLLSDNPDQARYPRKQCVGGECLIIGRIIHKQSEYI